MKLRTRDLAAILVAAAVLVLCALALKTAFQELGSPMPSPERSSPPFMTQDSRKHREPTNPRVPPATMTPEKPQSTTAMPAPHQVPAVFTLPYPAPPPPEEWRRMDATARLIHARTRLMPKLHEELAARNCRLGQPAFIRIFKESRELELWLQAPSGGWNLFRTYPIACFSGTLGPKTREGDMQAPEGFYTVTSRMLNPASNYHLAFNIGYPNTYDRAHQRTGSLIMVHGDECSIGCFAMTDPFIEEIYLIVQASLTHTPGVSVHSFPFRMTPQRLAQADPAHLHFWQELLPAYEAFEKERRVPDIHLESGRYALR